MYLNLNLHLYAFTVDVISFGYALCFQCQYTTKDAFGSFFEFESVFFLFCGQYPLLE